MNNFNKSDEIKEITFFANIGNIGRGVNHLLILKDDRLALCSNNKSIKVYNIQDLSFPCDIHQKDAHSDCIIYISQTKDGRLLSSSLDKTIKIWEILKDHLKGLHTIQDNLQFICIIPLTYHRLCASNLNNKIIIYDDITYQQLFSFEIDEEYSQSVIQLKNKEILVSGTNSNVTFYDLNKIIEIKKINNVSCSQRNSIFQINDELIAIGGKNIIYLINLKIYQIQICFEDKLMRYIDSFAIINDNILLCGCYRGRLYQINTMSFEIKFLRESNDEWSINTIAIPSPNTIITGSNVKYLRLYKITINHEKM